MQYYTFTRTYQVRAHSYKDARVIFSRALENREEDQYYVGTNLPYPQQRIAAGILFRFYQLCKWIWPEVKSQLFGYPKYTGRRL